MIRLYLFNSVCRKEVGQVSLQDLRAGDNVVAMLIKKFEELGCVIELGRGSLYIAQGNEYVPFEESLLCSDNATVAYVDIIKPDNAKEYDRKDGIKYFFHTAEQGHWYVPHIHAEYSGAELWINLQDFGTLGSLGNRKKEKEAMQFIKDNIEDIRKEWNEIITEQGGPKWEG